MINLFIFFLVSLVLTFLIFMVVYLISSRQDALDYEKKSAYECGFEPFGDSRSFFDVQFYVIGLLFVVFDLEVVFLIPFIADISNISLFGYLNFLLFMGVVLIGFFYEWKIGLLNWVPTQNKLYYSNNGIFLFVLILAPQVFAGTVKSIRNAYFLVKYYTPQVWELLSLPLQCLLVVLSLIAAAVAYRRYVLDVEKQFPFTNPYQFAKIELERRELEMEKMQENTRGSIATLFFTIAVWLSFKVWPIYSGDKRNFFAYWGDLFYNEFYKNHNPLPATKLDLIHPDVENAVAFQTMERTNLNNITNLWEYGAMLRNENYTSPMEARYDRLACHADGWKAMHRTVVQPRGLSDIGDENLVWKYHHVVLRGDWKSIANADDDEHLLPGITVRHAIDYVALSWKRELSKGLWGWKYEWVWDPETSKAFKEQKGHAVEMRKYLFPDLVIHRSSFEKINHLIKARGDEWPIILKYYKYFHNTHYYNRLFGINKGFMDALPHKLLQLPKAAYSENIFNQVGFPYSVGQYGTFYKRIHVPWQALSSKEIFGAFNSLPFNVEDRFFLHYDGRTAFEFPILAVFVLLSSVFVFKKVATFFCKNFINNFVKFWFFFKYFIIGKGKNLGFRNLLYGSTVVSDSKTSLEGLYWIFLKFQENLLEIIIHARWYHLIPAFLVLLLGLLAAQIGYRYAERNPSDDGAPVFGHRRHTMHGRFEQHSIWGKTKFFVISAPSDFLVDEFFIQQGGGHLSLYQKFFLLLPELVLCLGLFLILFYTGRSLSFLQSLTVHVFRMCFLSLIVTFSIIGAGRYTKCLFIFDEAYQFSVWSQCIKTFILMLAVFFILYFDLGDLVPNEFIKFLVIFILLAFVLASNRSFFLLLIALEGISLLGYVTASAEKSYGGIAAAVKYFSIGAVGSVLLLWSALHMYPVILHMSYDSVFILVRKYELQNFEMLEIIEFFSTLLTFGITIKMGIAPFHQWIADLYAGTSVYINAVFAILIKAVVFFSIFEVMCSLLCDVLFKFTLIYSLILGCYFSIKQNEVRRLIAYSSIVHTSFLLVGDAVVSITYMLTYICSNILFFASLLLYERMEGDESVWLNDLGNFSKYGYSNASLFSIGLFSMMGLPPFAGFFGKIMVWISLIEDFYFYNELYSYAFFILSVMLSIIISLYYIKIVIYIFAPKETAFIWVHGYDSIFINGLKSKLVVQYSALYFVVTWAFWHEDIISLVLFLVTDLC